MDGLPLRAEALGLTPDQLDRVARGALEITPGGALVAKLVAPSSVQPISSPGQRRAAIESMLAARKKLRQMGVTLTQAAICDLRNDHSA